MQAIYQAFGRGDVATILERLDDAVEWETTVPMSDVPWLQARRRKANIVGFFESLAPLKITRFEPHTIFDGGSAGKVVKYDHVTDTAQMIRMARGE